MPYMEGDLPKKEVFESYAEKNRDLSHMIGTAAGAAVMREMRRTPGNKSK